MSSNQEKNVPCPACSVNGYTVSGDPEVAAPVVDQCEMCDSQGEVEESYAKDWPFK